MILAAFAAGLMIGAAAAAGAVIGAVRAGHRLRPSRPPHGPHLACCYQPDTGQLPVQHQRHKRQDWRGAWS